MKNLLLSTILALTSVSIAELPNIVLIYADDLGYGDVSCYGATQIQTPNIDQLAAEGRKFTDAHSPSSVCTPSRYGLLTGEYPYRLNLWGPCSPTSKLIIDTHQETLASLLKKAGYDTSVIGKWHLGFTNDENDYSARLSPGPQDVGFDYFFGVPVVNSAPPYVYVENDQIIGLTPDDPIKFEGHGAQHVTPLTPLGKQHGGRMANWFSGATKAHELYNDFELGKQLTERAVHWISEREEAPFFLYFPTTNIHHPFTPAQRFQGSSEAGWYGDFTHELDWMVGEIVQALKDKGVIDNTLIIFTSDNGGMLNHPGQHAVQHGHDINGPLLGSKFGAWEGGHRIPMIARWPGKIPAGTTSDALISQIDFLATFASITGQELSDSGDSISQLATLTGTPPHPVREQLMICPNSPYHLSIRKGDWVYIPNQDEGGFQAREVGAHNLGGYASLPLLGKSTSDARDGQVLPSAPPHQLYNLATDLGQTQNVANEHPHVVAELKALLDTEYATIPKTERIGWINIAKNPSLKN